MFEAKSTHLNIEVAAPKYDARDYTIDAKRVFPEAFSLETVTVKNQGRKPTCVPHACSSVVEYHFKKQHGNYRRFSTEFLYGLREEDYYVGDGMRIRDALKTLLKYGTPYEVDCKGNHDYEAAMKNVDSCSDELKEKAYPHRISAYFKICNSEELKTALMRYGYVIVSMNTYEDAKLIDDVYTYDATKEHGRHCVFIYGWNSKGWLIQNSWGALYGGDGRFVIPFDYQFNEMWGIVDDIVEDNIQKPKRNVILDILYSIINLIINKFKS